MKAPRHSWPVICAASEWQGQWVAMDDCAFDEAGEATEGSIIDHDDNLAALCARLRSAQRSHCAVMFCPSSDHR